MLNNASGFRKVYIAAGYTDLRRGIDGLASIVKCMIIPGLFEPPVRTLRATIPENESHTFR